MKKIFFHLFQKDKATGIILSPIKSGILVSFAIFFASFLGIGWLYLKAYDTRTNAIRKDVSVVAQTAATTLNTEALKKLTSKEQQNGLLYQETIEPLIKIHNSLPEIYYLYTIREVGGKHYYVLDTSTQMRKLTTKRLLKPSRLMDSFEESHIPEAEEKIAYIRLGQNYTYRKPYTDQYGTFMSGFAPIKDKSGQVVGYVGVDFDIKDYFEELRTIKNAMWTSITISTLVSILVGIIVSRIQKLVLTHEKQRQVAQEQLQVSNNKLLKVNRQLEDSTKEAQQFAQEAQAATKAKSEFLAMMSHEIRTPLNGILGFTTLLLNSEISEEQREYVETIRSSGDALLILINDILDFSKIESGALQLESSPFNFRKCIHEVYDLLVVKAEAKGLVLAIDIDPDTPKHVYGDVNRLRQVILNLVDNAIKFTPKEEVLLSLRVNGYAPETQKFNMEFKIVDTGIGMSEEQLNRIFRPFVQAESNTSKRFGGTGLGLVISERLCEMMGGNITVASIAGKGSTFTLNLPFKEFICDKKDLDSINANEEIIISDLAQRYPLRILAADDNTTNQRILGLMLSKMGYHADFASNGIEVLEALKRQEYDIILMDVQMPEMDGLDACRAIRKKERSSDTKNPICIVAITAFAMDEDKEKCFSAGMNSYIAKPIKISELTRTITNFAHEYFNDEKDNKDEKEAFSS